MEPGCSRYWHGFLHDQFVCLRVIFMLRVCVGVCECVWQSRLHNREACCYRSQWMTEAQTHTDTHTHSRLGPRFLSIPLQASHWILLHWVLIYFLRVVLSTIEFFCTPNKVFFIHSFILCCLSLRALNWDSSSDLNVVFIVICWLDKISMSLISLSLLSCVVPQ